MPDPTTVYLTSMISTGREVFINFTATENNTWRKKGFKLRYSFVETLKKYSKGLPGNK